MPSSYLILCHCPPALNRLLTPCPPALTLSQHQGLNPQPGIEPGTAAVKALSPNHWTPRKSLAYSLKQGSTALTIALLGDREEGY